MLSLLAKYVIKKARKKMKKADTIRLENQELPIGVTEIVDINYVNDYNPLHLLDIYYPDGWNKNTPLLIDIHGGAFIYGDKNLNKIYAYHLARLGFVVVNLSYRLAPAVELVEQLQDISKAFFWIKNNSSKYSLNLKNVFITGDSAGAYLGLLSTAINNSKKISTSFGCKPANLDIKAISLVSCVYDITHNITARALGRFLLPSKPKERPYYKYINPEALFKETALPPIFVATSDEDFLKNDSLILAKLLKQIGHTFKLIRTHKKPNVKLGHVFSVCYPQYVESSEVNADMAEFFKIYMKKDTKEN